MKQPLGFVIEDDLALGDIFSKALSNAGCAVEVIQDGRQALKRLETAVPNIIILDLNLPHVDGQEILHIIRQTPQFDKTVVIVATANSTWGRLLNDKANIVLDKPVSFVQLSRICERVVTNGFAV